MKIVRFGSLASLAALTVFAPACTGKGGGGKDATPTPSASPSPMPAPLYVSAAEGSDENDGRSPGDSFATIQHALVVASSLAPAEVRVAGGTYEGDPDSGTAVVLRPRVSLSGGWAADFSTRDPVANITTITSTAAVGSDTLAGVVVARGGHIQRDVVVDGFAIVGSGTSNAIAVVVADGASPTFSGNTIDGGDGALSLGMRIQTGGSPLVRGNHIRAGNSTSSSFGVSSTRGAGTFLDNLIEGGEGLTHTKGVNVSGFVILRGNTIHGGVGSDTTGVEFNATAGVVIENNVIRAGEGTSVSHGIRAFGSSGLIRHNTIDGGAGSEAAGIVLLSATNTIENNIVFTSGGATRRCIFENGSEPASFLNNDLFDCPAALYVDDGPTDLTDIGLVNALNGAGGNVSVDPQFEDPGLADDFHLTAATPASVREGALDLSTFLVDDRDGARRTQPASIGAYEQD